MINILGISKSCTDCQFSNGPQCDKYNCFVSACEAIYEAPAIDAVPIVRCKDCKHRDTENGFCEGRGWPMQLVPDDGFCDKGGRRRDDSM